VENIPDSQARFSGAYRLRKFTFNIPVGDNQALFPEFNSRGCLMNLNSCASVYLNTEDLSMSTIDNTRNSLSPIQTESPSEASSAVEPSAEAKNEFKQSLDRKEGDQSPSGQAAYGDGAVTKNPAQPEAAFTQNRGKAATDSNADEAKPKEAGNDDDLSSLMSRLYAERLGAQPAASEPGAVVANALPAGEAQAQEMLDRLVQQILVSHPGQAGDREVRLILQDSVLPNTEVRLSRGADGLLSVSLLTDRDDAFQTLVSMQATLKNQLVLHEQRDVRVVVTNTQEGQASDDASGRRSATYRAYQGDGERSADGKNS
jgi:type III secretion system needle length determinant